MALAEERANREGAQREEVAVGLWKKAASTPPRGPVTPHLACH